MRHEPLHGFADVTRERRDDRPPPRPHAPSPAGWILALQRGAGNAAVSRMLADASDTAAPDADDESVAADGTVADDGTTAVVDDAADDDEATPAPTRLPIGGGHDLTFDVVDGRQRLGVASDFHDLLPKLLAMIQAIDSHPNGQASALRIRVLAARLTAYDAAIDTRTRERNRLQKQAREKRSAAATLRQPQSSAAPNPYERPRRHLDSASKAGKAVEKARTAAREAQQRLSREEAQALAFARDALIEMWELGRDFLPVTLMPVGKVFQDRAFRGDTTRYRYFTGKSPQEAIPIIWYKRPEDYPDLVMPDGTVVAFGQAYTLQATTLTLGFGGQISLPRVELGVQDGPKLGWIVQKQMHEGVREGQVELNRMLNAHGVQVRHNGLDIRNPLSAWGGFDGDHVRDLGFGGRDEVGNYWPLAANINRRAFTGYNTGYVINYKREDGTHASRSIGGLVGHYFKVVGFMDPADGSVPTLDAASNGEPTNAQAAQANPQPADAPPIFDLGWWVNAIFNAWG